MESVIKNALRVTIVTKKKFSVLTELFVKLEFIKL